jgi:hypothetical protein
MLPGVWRSRWRHEQPAEAETIVPEGHVITCTDIFRGPGVGAAKNLDDGIAFEPYVVSSS